MNGSATPMPALRQQRAAALVPTVRRIEGGYRVAASSQDTEYLVTKPNGRIVCTCPDFRRHAEDMPDFKCKHILAVDMAYQDSRRTSPMNGKAPREISGPPSDTVYVFHRSLANEDPVRLKLIKNTKGYSWEIAVADTDAQAALDRLSDLEQKVRCQFGNQEEGE